MNKEEKAQKEKEENKKSLMIFVGVVSGLVLLGVVFHLSSDQSTESVETFFEQRKSPEEYHKYKQEEESSKRKAEKNIFLQN